MSQKVNYFLSYYRRGIAATAQGHTSGTGRRMVVSARVKLGAESDQGTREKEITQQLELLGPGDVLGINARIVSRVAPVANVNNFEANYCPFIEFREPDFLWRFSTGKTGQHWIPWLALIVLRPGGHGETAEFEELASGDRDLPPRILLKNRAVLPDLRELWRWAHVHLVDHEGRDLPTLSASLKQNPQQAVCRLLCTRRLKPATRYRAFLVPSFLIGLEAGLGLSDTTDDRTRLAWDDPAEATGRALPYYYDWSFRTDAGGDFEQLVRRLKPHSIPKLGTRTIDCSNPGYGMQQDGFTMEMEAPLKSLDTSSQKWGMDAQPPELQQSQLARLLNRREEGNGEQTKRRVTPPVYGEWYLRQGNETIRLDEKQKGTWLEELNLDFRHRAAAGLGVRFVRENQEQLMQAAWTQMSKIREANRALNLGRLGRSLSKSLYKRIDGMQPEAVFKLGLPLINRISMASGTGSRSIGKNTGGSPTLGAYLKNQAVTTNLTRAKVKKYLPNYKQSKVSTSTGGTQTMVNAFVSFSQQQVVTTNFIMGAAAPGIKTEAAQSDPDKLRQDAVFYPLGEQIKEAVDPKLTIESKMESRFQSLRNWEKRRTVGNQGRKTRGLKEGALDSLRPIMWHPEFHRPMYRFLRDMSSHYILPGLENIPPNTVGTLQTNRRFIEAFMIGLNHEMASELRWREFPTDLRGSYFRSFWDTTIYSLDDGEKKLFRVSEIGIRLLNKMKTTHGLAFNSFPKIEATYAKGDANEMERSVAAEYEAAVEQWLLTREEDKDIDHPANWRKISRLGNHPRSGGRKNKKEDQSQLVVLVRGELLQKFRNTLLYLVKRKQGTATPSLDQAADKIFPIFEGALPPDIAFVGFPITKEETGEFFLVFEERATTLRFGLDDQPQANSEALVTMGEKDMSWQHFPKVDTEAYLDGNTPLILSGVWNSAARIAKAMLQKQVRMAVPLDSMLP